METEKLNNTRSIGPVTVSTGASAALTMCVCWILEANGVHVPTEVQGAFTVLFVFLAGWLIPPRKKGKRSL